MKEEINEGKYIEAYNIIENILVKTRCGNCFTFGDGVYWALEKLKMGAIKLDEEEK